MLDLNFIRENQDVVKKAIQDKCVNLDLDEILTLDKAVVSGKTAMQELQENKNRISKEIPKASNDDRPDLIAKSKEIGLKMDKMKPALEENQNKLQELLYKVPNIPMESAPVGKGEEDNIVIKKWGEIPEFDFNVRDHVDILEMHNWADFKRVAKVSGSRTYCLKGDMVLLELALHRFFMEKLVKRGFEILTMPALVREDALYATGHFPSGREDIYDIPRDNLFLSGTAEVALNSLHKDEILDEDDLPITYGGYSPCFRREAGSAGKDVRGLLRVHQFSKVEQYIICKADFDESAEWHQKLLGLSEEMLQELELPYQVIECSTGDMGTGKYRMNDIETWVPTLDAYRETHSCSTLHDWQARRTNIRYRDKAGNVKFAYTLNNTGVATPRILVPFLECHQMEDGKIKIPTALQSYMNGQEALGK